MQEYLGSLGQADVLLNTSQFLELCAWQCFSLIKLNKEATKETSTCSEVLLKSHRLLVHSSKYDAHSNIKNLRSVMGSGSSGTSTAAFPQASSLPTRGTQA